MHCTVSGNPCQDVGQHVGISRGRAAAFRGSAAEFLCGLKAAQESAVEEQGNDQGHCVGDDLGPGKPGQAHHRIHEEEQGNLYDARAAAGHHQGLRPFAHSLEHEADVEVADHQRCGQTVDPQKDHAHGNGVRVVDKDLDGGPGKQLKHNDAEHRKSHAAEAGLPDGFFHSPEVLGGIIVSHQRQHALAQAHAHVHGQHLDFFHDAQRCHGNIPVTGRQLVDDHVGHTGKQISDGGWKANRKNRTGIPGPGQNPAGGHREHGAVAEPEENDGKVTQGGHVGEHGGNGCAGDFLPGRQKHKHEQRVQRNVEDTAHAQAEAGLAGIALTAQQVGHGQAQHGGQPADDHHPEGIPGGIIHRVGAGTQQVQQRFHKKQAEHRVQQRHENRAVKTEGTDLFGLLRLAVPQQAGDQAAAADAEQVGKSVQDKEQGIGQGGCGHFVRVFGAADEKGVGQVVDHGDELADDGGHRQSGQRPGYRHGFEQVLVVIHGWNSPPRCVRRSCFPGPAGAGRKIRPAVPRTYPAAESLPFCRQCPVKSLPAPGLSLSGQ